MLTASLNYPSIKPQYQSSVPSHCERAEMEVNSAATQARLVNFSSEDPDEGPWKVLDGAVDPTGYVSALKATPSHHRKGTSCRLSPCSRCRSREAECIWYWKMVSIFLPQLHFLPSCTEVDVAWAGGSTKLEIRTSFTLKVFW